VILQWFKSALAVVVLYGAIPVIAVQKMFTEDYRPWKGEDLTDLAIVRGQGPVRITEDSPAMRAALSLYGSTQRPAMQHSQRIAPVFSPGSSVDPELINELKVYPYFEVPARTHCKILKRTNIPCHRDMYTSTFVKVRVTSGTFRRREGFVCDAEIPRTVALP
jgi:hypothetical protein